MSSSGIFDFTNKFCKNGMHHDCCGQWRGFGFDIVCNCGCHGENRVLARSEASARTNGEQSTDGDQSDQPKEKQYEK